MHIPNNICPNNIWYVVFFKIPLGYNIMALSSSHVFVEGGWGWNASSTCVYVPEGLRSKREIWNCQSNCKHFAHYSPNPRIKPLIFPRKSLSAVMLCHSLLLVQSLFRFVSFFLPLDETKKVASLNKPVYKPRTQPKMQNLQGWEK